MLKFDQNRPLVRKPLWRFVEFTKKILTTVSGVARAFFGGCNYEKSSITCQWCSELKFIFTNAFCDLLLDYKVFSQYAPSKSQHHDGDIAS